MSRGSVIAMDKMKIDVIYVTYNSEKWIESCFASWKTMQCAALINIIVVDNASTDNTIACLEREQKALETSVNSFKIIQLPENVGFGEANNIGFKNGESELVCFFNIDTEIEGASMNALLEYVQQADENVGVWELRQIPYEHPKVYNPVTLETTWSSGAAFAARRAVFDKVGGFDKDFFMYAEDVDLSWRIRALGWRIMYCPKAVILHKTYADAGEIKFIQYAYSIRNNILMRYRYGTKRDVLDGYVLFLKLMLSNKLGIKFNQKVAKIVLGIGDLRKRFRATRVRGNVAHFDGLNYSDMRYGAFYVSEKDVKQIDVSVYVVGDTQEQVTDLDHCIENQTCRIADVQRVSALKDIITALEQKQDSEITWISILQESELLYADHYETLVGLLQGSEYVVATVDSAGALSNRISTYLISSEFILENQEAFIQNDMNLIIKKCCETAKSGAKQTVL